MNKLEMKYQTTKKIESLQRKLVWHLPHWLIMWAVVRATLHASNGKWSKDLVNEIPAVEVLRRWDEDNKE
jgi:hypothetical protein